MGEGFRRARAAPYRQREDIAFQELLEPDLLRLMRGVLSTQELLCECTAPREDISAGARGLLIVDPSGESGQIIVGTLQVGAMTPSALSLLLAARAESLNCGTVITSLPITIGELDAFDDFFRVRIAIDDH